MNGGDDDVIFIQFFLDMIVSNHNYIS